MAVAAPKSTESAIRDALLPSWQTIAQITEKVYAKWSKPEQLAARVTVAGILDSLVKEKRAVAEWEPKLAASVYRWKNPHEDGCKAVQEVFQSLDKERKANGNSAKQDSNMEATEMGKAKEKSKKATAKLVRSIPVDFGTVSLGADTARIGVTINRGRMTLDDADSMFTNRRLLGRVVITPDADPAQKTIVDDIDRHLQGAFDVKGFRVTKDSFSCGLTFAIQELDLNDVGHFSKKKGRIDVEDVGDLAGDEDDEDDEDDGE